MEYNIRDSFKFDIEWAKGRISLDEYSPEEIDESVVEFKLAELIQTEHNKFMEIKNSDSSDDIYELWKTSYKQNSVISNSEFLWYVCVYHNKTIVNDEEVVEASDFIKNIMDRIIERYKNIEKWMNFNKLKKQKLNKIRYNYYNSTSENWTFWLKYLAVPSVLLTPFINEIATILAMLGMVFLVIGHYGEKLTYYSIRDKKLEELNNEERDLFAFAKIVFNEQEARVHMIHQSLVN